MPLMRLTPRAKPADHVRAFSEAIREAGFDDRQFAYLVAPPGTSPSTPSEPNAKADTDSGGGDGGDGVAPPATSSMGWLALSYLVVAGFWGIAVAVWSWRNPAGFTPGAGISVFAPLYIVAQALERLIEPLTSFVQAKSPTGSTGLKASDPTGVIANGTNVTKADATYNVNLAIQSGHATLAAQWQGVVDQIRKNTAILAWTAASSLAILACGTFGLYMMRAVGFVGVPKWCDILITGLAIGSGTKPLHDLISNLQTSKDAKEDPAEKQAA